MRVVLCQPCAQEYLILNAAMHKGAGVELGLAKLNILVTWDIKISHVTKMFNVASYAIFLCNMPSWANVDLCKIKILCNFSGLFLFFLFCIIIIILMDYLI